MNIFYLDEDIKTNVTYYVDTHVVKMILETAQILCTVVNEAVGSQVTPYKSTHKNHPCVEWAGESHANWRYLCSLMLSLEIEWNYRYKHAKRHKAVDAFLNPRMDIVNLADTWLPKKPFTLPPLCMPEHCKVGTDVVASYRNYYNLEKRHLFKWTNREVPFWIDLGEER